jgi:hypothetical protein
MFSPDLREAVASGEITVSIRLWSRPKVKPGGRYATAGVVIEIESVELLQPRVHLRVARWCLRSSRHRTRVLRTWRRSPELSERACDGPLSGLTSDGCEYRVAMDSKPAPGCALMPGVLRDVAHLDVTGVPFS